MEWLSYRFGDLVLFSRDTLLRTLEIWNELIWPWQLLAIALSILAVATLWWNGSSRIAHRLAALGWVLPTIFLATRYHEINWVGRYVAGFWAVAGITLLVPGVRDERGSMTLGVRLLVCHGLLIHPAVTVLTRGVRSSDVFGVTPDATAIVLLAAALTGENRIRWLIVPAPLGWLVLASAVAVHAHSWLEASSLGVALVGGAAILFAKRRGQFETSSISA